MTSPRPPSRKAASPASPVTARRWTTVTTASAVSFRMEPWPTAMTRTATPPLSYTLEERDPGQRDRRHDNRRLDHDLDLAVPDGRPSGHADPGDRYGRQQSLARRLRALRRRLQLVADCSAFPGSVVRLDLEWGQRQWDVLQRAPVV